jgi:hypothetical protein
MAKLIRNRMLKKNLPTKAARQLAVLEENEVVLNAMLINYNERKINRCLADVNSQIAVLEANRDDIIENRLDVCVEKTAEYEKRIEENNDKQLAIIIRHSSITKLAKMMAKVKELEAQIVIEQESVGV